MKRIFRLTALILAALLLFALMGCSKDRSGDVQESNEQKSDAEENAAPESGTQESDTQEAGVLSDGIYQIAVTLTGGTGKASVASPARLTVRNGKMTAAIVWSSANYDYMLVDEVRYEAEIIDGHSVFSIPVAALDTELPVIADTVAMSVPHEIAYTLRFDSSSIKEEEAPEWSSLSPEKELELRYATQFRVTEYTGGYQLAEIDTAGRFLIIPEGEALPAGLPEDIVPMYQPLQRMYLAATSAMDFFRALQSIDSIRLSGTDTDGWYIQEAKDALNDGSMLFAGKYNAPDFELIFSEQCDLAIESTMIYHSPEIKEQLEKLGVPVLVERSSYEEHPLGRMEWIKFYGTLLGKEKEAVTIFDAEAAAVEALEGQSKTGKTAAFFYINAAGTVNVRKSDDYVPRMIDMAGGEYVFSDLESGSALSTVNMTMEAFYDGAKNADVLIYNSTIDGELQTMDELLAKSPLLSNFKAVKSGDVWCTGKNLFQEPMGLGRLILDMHQILTGEVPEDGELTYMHKLLIP